MLLAVNSSLESINWALHVFGGPATGDSSRYLSAVFLLMNFLFFMTLFFIKASTKRLPVISSS